MSRAANLHDSLSRPDPVRCDARHRGPGVNERILIIDDDAVVRDVARAALERDGYIVQAASAGTDGIALSASRSPALIVLDLGLPDVPGEAVLQEVRRR